MVYDLQLYLANKKTRDFTGFHGFLEPWGWVGWLTVLKDHVGRSLNILNNQKHFFDEFDLPRLKSLAPNSSQFYGMIWPWQPFSKQKLIFA